MTVDLSGDASAKGKVTVTVLNDGDHLESIAVYVDVIPPAGGGCQPGGRVRQSVVVLNPGTRRSLIVSTDNWEEVYILFGRSDLPGAVDIALGQQDVTLFPHVGLNSNGYVLAAGDVNGDQIEDAIVSQRQADVVWVVFGRLTWPQTMDLSTGPSGQQNATLFGTSGGYFGGGLASGDINGDGVGDVVVSDSSADRSSALNAGQVYVFSGSPSFGGTLRVDSGDQAMTIQGADANDHLGGALAAGDVNGDGFGDILISAGGGDGVNNSTPDVGEAYLVVGSPVLEDVDTLASQQEAILVGAGGAFGASVAVGDANGDGLADMLIGAPGAGVRKGEAYLFISELPLPPVADVQSVPPAVTVRGLYTDAQFGTSVAMGDLTADGSAEMIVGASGSFLNSLGNGFAFNVAEGLSRPTPTPAPTPTDVLTPTPTPTPTPTLTPTPTPSGFHDSKVTHRSRGPGLRLSAGEGTVDRPVTLRVKNNGDHPDTIRATLEVVGLEAGCTATHPGPDGLFNGASDSTVGSGSGLLVDDTSTYTSGQAKDLSFVMRVICSPVPVGSAFAMVARADHDADDGLSADDDDANSTANVVTRVKIIK